MSIKEIINKGLNFDASDTDISKLVDTTTSKVLHEFSGKGQVKCVTVIDNVVCFTGMSGGAGTSTIVANIADSIASKGMKVLVVDMNILYPIQHMLLGFKQRGEKKDLVSFMIGKNNIGDSIETSGNISILFANNRYLIDYVNCDNKQASDNLKGAINNIRGLFDMILIDCPNIVQFDPINVMMFNADKIYAVWDESGSCVANVDRIRKNMEQTGIDFMSKCRVLFSKKTSIYYSKSTFVELGLGDKVVGTVPFDTAIIESGLRGEVFCRKGASMSKNATVYAKEISKIADRILEIGGYNSGR